MTELLKSVAGWASDGWVTLATVALGLFGLWYANGGLAARRRKTTRDLLALHKELPDQGWSDEKNLLERRLRIEIRRLGLEEQPPKARSWAPVLTGITVLVLFVLGTVGTLISDVPAGAEQTTLGAWLSTASAVVVGLAGLTITTAVAEAAARILARRQSEQIRKMHQAQQEETVDKAVDKAVEQVNKNISESLR